MDQTKRRNPIISFLLSIILPGLGHVYNGHLLEGTLLFLGWLLILIILGLSGLTLSLWGLICIIIIIVICPLLIAAHAAIEAARLKEVHLKWYNKWYIYPCIVLVVNIGFLQLILKVQHHFLKVGTFKIPAVSMAPTLEKGDHFIAKLGKYGDRLPQRGDVVIFPYPEDRSKNFVKRVIGLPGERIEIRDKVVFVNGKRLGDPWGVHFDPTTIPERDDFGPVDIPEGSVFVLGDNRDFSYDSRFWGFVEIKAIEGKPVFIYWSNDRNRIGKQLD